MRNESLAFSLALAHIFFLNKRILKLLNGFLHNRRESSHIAMHIAVDSLFSYVIPALDAKGNIGILQDELNLEVIEVGSGALFFFFGFFWFFTKWARFWFQKLSLTEPHETWACFSRSCY